MILKIDPTPTIQAGTFVIPAGAQLRSVADEGALANVWKEVQRCFGHPKPDGWRMQIHKMRDEVFLFSRSGKDWTAEFPAVVKMIRNRAMDDIILGTELVAFDAQGSHVGPSKLRNAPRNCVLREDKGPKEATSFEQLLEIAHLDEPPEPIKRVERARQWQPSLLKSAVCYNCL